MITIKRLIEKLQALPQDSLVYGYEGEVSGIIVVDPDDSKGWHTQRATIIASESKRIEDNDED